MKNDGVLPLKSEKPKDPKTVQPKKTVLLTGPNANTMWAMCGDYTYQAMAYFWKKTDVGSECPHIVTLKEGMDKWKDFDVVSHKRKISNLLLFVSC